MKVAPTATVFLLVVAISCLFDSSFAQTDQQRQALENVDVDNILRNEKLVQRHIACVLDNGRCDTNGRDLKGNLFLMAFLYLFIKFHAYILYSLF